MLCVKEEKMMNSLAKENKTNQIFHRMFTDPIAKECAGGRGLPKREGEGKKLKPSVLTFAKKQREHRWDGLETR